jgi:hypothetical protein
MDFLTSVLGFLAWEWSICDKLNGSGSIIRLCIKISAQDSVHVDYIEGHVVLALVGVLN